MRLKLFRWGWGSDPLTPQSRPFICDFPNGTRPWKSCAPRRRPAAEGARAAPNVRGPRAFCRPFRAQYPRGHRNASECRRELADRPYTRNAVPNDSFFGKTELLLFRPAVYRVFFFIIFVLFYLLFRCFRPTDSVTSRTRASVVRF